MRSEVYLSAERSPAARQFSKLLYCTCVHHLLILNRFINFVSVTCSVVPVKEASIIIAISSPHRQESLEAVNFAINTVKAVVPVWKKVRSIVQAILIAKIKLLSATP